MKSGLMDKLSSYAALIGVIGAIGGGFYTWGEFNNRLSAIEGNNICLLYTSPSPRDLSTSRMPSSA